MNEHRDRKQVDDHQQPTNVEPSAWSAVMSNLGALLVTAVMAGGIVWWTVDVNRQEPDEFQRTAEDDTTERQSHSGSTNGSGSGNGNGNGNAEAVVRSPSANGHTPANMPEFDASRTSWQNPFSVSYWESDGWIMRPDVMQSSDRRRATATFRRGYRKITVECRVAPVGDPGVFQIRLFAPTTNALMQAEFSREMVKVSSTLNRKNALIKQRRFPVPFVAGKPTTLRLTATGNRVLVICDGKVVLNCGQPAEQSGKLLRFSLRTEGGIFRISSLRLEGE